MTAAPELPCNAEQFIAQKASFKKTIDKIGRAESLVTDLGSLYSVGFEVICRCLYSLSSSFSSRFLIIIAFAGLVLLCDRCLGWLRQQVSPTHHDRFDHSVGLHFRMRH